jgi:hypothetical protein
MAALTVKVPHLPAEGVDVTRLIAPLSLVKVLVVASGLSGRILKALLAPSPPGAAKKVEAFVASKDVGLLIFSGSGDDELAFSIAIRELFSASSALKPPAVIAVDLLSTLAGLGPHTEVSHVTPSRALSKALSAASLPSLQAPDQMEGVAAEALSSAVDGGVKTVVGIHINTRASELASPALAQRLADSLVTLGKSDASLSALAELPPMTGDKSAWQQRLKDASHVVAATTEKQGISMFA